MDSKCRIRSYGFLDYLLQRDDNIGIAVRCSALLDNFMDIKGTRLYIRR